MMVKIPFNSVDALFRLRKASEGLTVIATLRSFTLKRLREEAEMSRRVSESLVRTLLYTEHLERRGKKFFATDLVGADFTILNLHDARCDKLFRHKPTRSLLLALCRCEEGGPCGLSARLGVPYRSLERALKLLRDVGIVSDIHLNENTLVHPTDAISFVPRKAHRIVLQDFVYMIVSRKLSYPLILFGPASDGEDTLKLDIMTLLRGYMRSDDIVDAMKAVVSAATNITSTHGVTLETWFALEEVWLAQKLGFAKNPNPTLARALEGICIYGKTPEKHDYFEIHQTADPAPPTKLAEWVSKGYVEKVGERYVYTDKAFQAFKSRAPTNIIEASIPILGKEVKFLTVGPKPAPRE